MVERVIKKANLEYRQKYRRKIGTSFSLLLKSNLFLCNNLI